MARLAAQPSRRYRGSVKTLSSISRVNLLRELQTHGPQTVAELAAATGLHSNTAREHLQLLIRAGYVNAESIYRPAKGRPWLRYCAANPPPTGDVVPRDGDPGTTQQNTRSTASLNRQLDALNTHLNVCGFTSALAPGEQHMTIRDCPFSDLARHNPQVCAMHHALVQSVLEHVNGPLGSPELHPFTDVNECTIDFDGNGRESA